MTCLTIPPRKHRKSGQGVAAINASVLPNASNQAIVGVSAPSPLPISRRQSAQGHPFASANAIHTNNNHHTHHTADRDNAYDSSNMAVPSQAGLQPITPMTVNGRPGNTRDNSQRMGEADYDQKGGNGFLRLVSCGCCR